MSISNHRVTLAARPVGFPKESDFAYTEESLASPADGSLLIRTQLLSLDPYMRGRMNEARAYSDPVEIGGVMIGGTVGTVIESRNSAYEEGDTVVGNWGWQEYTLSKGSALQKVDPSLAPVSTALGVLGMPGMTAYFGLLEICEPKAGETLFVSGAAGAVGSLVGQIGKIKGCTVVGSAGSDEKVQFILEEDGFDAAFNYKTTDNYLAKVQELCPKGVDCYFDNVGGAMSDAIYMSINPFARISICGQISQYNLEKPEKGPRLMSMLLIRQARAQGFLVFQFADKYREGMEQMASWLKEGKIRYREDITDGLENAPAAFIGMLNGANRGKQLIRVWDGSA